MREIEDKRHQRLRVAKAWRTHLGEIAQYQFEITEYQAHCTYQVSELFAVICITHFNSKNVFFRRSFLTLSCLCNKIVVNEEDCKNRHGQRIGQKAAQIDLGINSVL